MSQEFACSVCGAEIDAASAEPGAEAVCGSCGARNPVPEEPGPEAFASPAPGASYGEPFRCPSCKGVLPPDARACHRCGTGLPRSFWGTMTVGGVLSQSFAILGGNFVPLFALAVVVYSPWILDQLYVVLTGRIYLLFASGGWNIHRLIYTWMDTVLGHLLTGATVFAVFQLLRGQGVGLWESMQVGLQRLPQVLLTAIFTGVVVGIGLFLLIIPGIVFWLMFFVAVPAAVVERLSVLEAMSRSVQLTRGRRWSILGLVVVIGLLSFLPILTLTWVLPDSVMSGGWFLLIGGFVALVIAILNAVAAAVVYHDLRVEKEGIDSDSLASVFD